MYSHRDGRLSLLAAAGAFGKMTVSASKSLKVLSHPRHLEEKVIAKASGLGFQGEDVSSLLKETLSMSS